MVFTKGGGSESPPTKVFAAFFPSLLPILDHSKLFVSCLQKHSRTVQLSGPRHFQRFSSWPLSPYHAQKRRGVLGRGQRSACAHQTVLGSVARQGASWCLTGSKKHLSQVLRWGSVPMPLSQCSK